MPACVHVDCLFMRAHVLTLQQCKKARTEKIAACVPWSAHMRTQRHGVDGVDVLDLERYRPMCHQTVDSISELVDLCRQAMGRGDHLGSEIKAFPFQNQIGHIVWLPELFDVSSPESGRSGR